MKQEEQGNNENNNKNDNNNKKSGIRWDEENLEENEKIKKELNPRKIDEPKTPYLSPHATDDEMDVSALEGISPDTLNESLTTETTTAAHPKRFHIRKSAFSDSSGNNSPSHQSNGSTRGDLEGRSPRFSEEYYKDDDFDDDEDKNPEKIEKKRKFLEMRKQHYKMKEVLHLKDGGSDEEEYDAVEKEKL